MTDETEQPKPAPRPPWRPSEYDPSYCDQVLEWGRAGKSRAWICATIGVVRQTLKNWEAAHPDFLVAMERAKLEEQRWWEDSGQDGMVADKFNSGVWVRSMAARFPDDWRETKDVALTGTLQVTEIKRTIVDPRDSDT